MASANGRLTPDELAVVETVYLAKGTANAYQRMKTAAAAAGVPIWIALPIGGYRDFFVQGDMKVRPKLYGLNPDSTVNVAAAGYSTHGWGTRVDIGSFPPATALDKYGAAGRRRREWLLANSERYGFVREFGELDPNHFKHDGVTGIGAIVGAGGTGAIIDTEEDDMYTDADRTRDNQVAASVAAFYRASHGRLLDLGDLGVLQAQLAAILLPVAQTRQAIFEKDQWEGIDALLRRMATQLEGIDNPTGELPDVPAIDGDAVAKALLPALLAGLGDSLVTDDDLADTRDQILAAVAGTDEATLAAFGLKRA